MEIEIRSLGRNLAEIAPAGELDESQRDQLRTHLLDGPYARRGGVLVDLSRVERIDPAGMALLMLARVEFEARDAAFVVLADRKTALRDALARAGMGRFVRIAGSRPEAMRMLARPALGAAA